MSIDAFQKALNDLLSGTKKPDGSPASPYFKKADKVVNTVRGKTVIPGYVDVTYKKKTYRSCRVNWEPIDFDQQKSTVRVVHRNKHYILWFYDSDLADQSGT